MIAAPHFHHVHPFSEDPIAAGEFYVKHFGGARRGPQLFSDNVNILSVKKNAAFVEGPDRIAIEVLK